MMIIKDFLGKRRSPVLDQESPENKILAPAILSP